MLNVIHILQRAFHWVSVSHPFSVRVTVVITSSFEELICLERVVVVVTLYWYYLLFYCCHICHQNIPGL